MPIDSNDVYNNDQNRNHREMMMHLYKRITLWARYNQEILVKIPQQHVTDCEMLKLKELHDAWQQTFLVDFIDDRVLHMHIFVELSRSHFLLHYNQMVEEQGDIMNRDGIPDEDRDYMILWKPNYNPESDKKVIMYTQQDIYDSLLYITERLNYTPHEEVPMMRRFVQLLYIRNGIFLCDNLTGATLDIPNMYDAEHKRPTKDWVMFTSIYFRAIQRRFFYMDAFDSYTPSQEGASFSIPPEFTANTQKWFEEEVCEALGSQGFQEFYRKACDDAYDFPGDREWFSYRNPGSPLHRGPILDSIRKPMSKRYFSEYRISKDTVLSNMNNYDQQGHCSRTLLLMAIDQYLANFYGFRSEQEGGWRTGVTIANDDLETQQDKIYREKSPKLVQRFSLFETYVNKQVYQSDNIYTTIAAWFYFVKRPPFGGKIFGFDLSEICTQKILKHTL